MRARRSRSARGRGARHASAGLERCWDVDGMQAPVHARRARNIRGGDAGPPQPGRAPVRAAAHRSTWRTALSGCARGTTAERRAARAAGLRASMASRARLAVANCVLSLGLTTQRALNSRARAHRAAAGPARIQCLAFRRARARARHVSAVAPIATKGHIRARTPFRSTAPINQLASGWIQQSS